MAPFSKVARILILAAFVAGCGGGERSAPRELDNACAIVAERPQYLRALRATERQWGVPVPVLMATIYQESRFVGNARTPFRYVLGVIPAGRQSSAFGYSQALDGTWEEYQAATGNHRHRRDNISHATNFMGWYMNQSRERNGIALNDTRRQYLAYHEGWTGYARGSYNRKAWLVRVAGELEARAAMYDAQLRSCGRR